MVSVTVLIVFLVVISVYLCGCLVYHLRDVREDRAGPNGSSRRYAPRRGEARAIPRAGAGAGDDPAGHGEGRGNQDHPDRDLAPQAPPRHGPRPSAAGQPASVRTSHSGRPRVPSTLSRSR